MLALSLSFAVGLEERTGQETSSHLIIISMDSKHLNLIDTEDVSAP